MLDIRFIRENADLVKQGLEKKRATVDIDRLLDLDRRRRDILAELESLREKRNRVSAEVAVLKKSKQDATALIADMKQVGDKISANDQQLREVEEELNRQLYYVPNLPHASVPVGGEEAGVVRRTWGKNPEFSFSPLPHWELGAKLGMIDLERGAKISGSGFILYTGIGAKLERALINFMIDVHTSRHGYQEVSPPFLVNRQTMTGTGQLPKMEEDMYKLSDDTMFLVPTAEVPVTNIYANDILNPEDLPKKFVAYTPCFRREAGAAGKDTLGLIRVPPLPRTTSMR